MFCRCEVAYFDPPNTHTCPVCLALPGALPVPNRQAVEWTILLGLALGCQIPERAIFHRKNYFYPDNPKGYQISQYDQPLCVDGSFEVPGADGDRVIGIERAHLEEDAAKTIHVGGAEGRIHGAEHSLVDFNRSGTPLVEIVTKPDIRSPEEAKAFLQLLRQTVVELGISDAEMEKGSLRFDVNVSVRPEGSDELRTRTELKNMNSFNFAAKGIEREVRRQIEIYESGRSGRPGDAPLRPGQRVGTAAALEGGGAGLPLLPGARPRAARARRRAGRAPARGAPGAAVGAGAAARGGGRLRARRGAGHERARRALLAHPGRAGRGRERGHERARGARARADGCERGGARQGDRRARRDPAQRVRRSAGRERLARLLRPSATWPRPRSPTPASSTP